MKQLFLFVAIYFASYNRKVQQTRIKVCNQIGASQFDIKKLILFSLLVILGLHSLGQIPAYVPTNGLVGYWPFNGNANDESGNGNSGTVNGASLTTDRYGNSGSAYFFGVNTSQDISIQNLQITGDWTISLWFLPTTSNINSQNYLMGVKCQSYWAGIGQSFSNPQCGIPSNSNFIFDGNQGCSNWLAFSQNYSLSAYNYLCVTYSSGIYSISINGQPSDSSSTLLDLDINDIVVGSRCNDPSTYNFDGSIDDIGIWNRALTLSEIQALFNSGQLATINSISNKTYCNLQTVASVPLSGTPSGVVFDIIGGASRGLPNQTNVSAIPAFTALTGSSVITVTPKYNGISGIPTTYTLTVSNCPAINLNLKFYIQGYYEGAGLMRPVLYNQGESTNPNTLQTDQVIVELHAATSPYTTIKTTIATLNKNGTLTCSFNGSVTNTPYYIVIHHRNSIVTWSAAPVMMIPNATYDFSNAPSKAYGNNMIEVEPNIWAMYNGDLNQDEAIDANDYLLLDIDIQGFASGYYASDINGDGTVDSNDYLILDANIQGFITSSTP